MNGCINTCTLITILYEFIIPPFCSNRLLSGHPVYRSSKIYHSRCKFMTFIILLAIP